MGHIYSINKTKRNELKHEIKQMKNILKYSSSKKTKLVNLSCNCIGFNSTAYLLNKYIEGKE